MLIETIALKKVRGRLGASRSNIRLCENSSITAASSGVTVIEDTVLSLSSTVIVKLPIWWTQCNRLSGFCTSYFREKASCNLETHKRVVKADLR